MSDYPPQVQTQDASPEPGAALQDAARAVELQLRIMRSELLDLQTRLAAGDQSAIRDGARLLADVRYWLKQANELETQIETQQRKATGHSGHDHAIDFDAARSQIRCRLDRLRDCRGPKIVS